LLQASLPRKRKPKSYGRKEHETDLSSRMRRKNVS
jgi:hypothetical protein